MERYNYIHRHSAIAYFLAIKCRGESLGVLPKMRQNGGNLRGDTRLPWESFYPFLTLLLPVRNVGLLLRGSVWHALEK